jgi:peroxiredoxin
MTRNYNRFKLLGLIVLAGLTTPALSASAGLELPPSRSVVGKPIDWSAPKGGATVVVFYSSECPISNEFSPTLKALAALEPKRVNFVGVAVDFDLSDADLARHGAEHGLPFPLVCDRDGKLARRLGARMTPEAVVLDDSGAVRYRGRIDDQFAARMTRNAHPSKPDLKEAILAVLGGKEPAKPWPEPVGCPIPDAPKAAAPPVYTHDVLPILQKSCQACHRKGQVGPFALDTYEQARKRADLIATEVSERQMPPWKAVPGFGPRYKHDKALSDAEIRTLVTWAEAGAPEGNKSDTPAPATFSEDWSLGSPDIVLQPASEYSIPAAGGDIYRCFVVKTNLPADTYVRAAEVRPGNRKVVHHVLSYVDISGEARKKDNADAEQGYECFGGPGVRVHSGLFGWAPGNEAHFLPDGIGVSLPKGADVIIQVHYHPDGKPETDLTRVGLFLCKTPVKQALHNAFAANMALEIPAGDSHREIRAKWDVPVDVTVLSATPHMHQIGRHMEMAFRFPDGKRVENLVKIDDWDFGWQFTYWLDKPLDVPKGSKLEIVSHYDNSEANPRSPKPLRTIRWGEATTDEMCIGFVGVVKTGQDLTRPGEKDDLGEILMKQWEEDGRRYQAEAKRRAEAKAKPGQ